MKTTLGIGFRTLAKAAIVVLTAIVLTGCGKSMSGTYANDMMQVEFKSGSKAYLTMKMSGSTVEASYSVDGDKITLKNQAGNIVFTQNSDGTLGGGPAANFAGPLKKVK
jgi:uncharacterized lipoprotein YehR (DUF1307 family)